MSVAAEARSGGPSLFSVDVGWRNFAFSLRTAAAAISALALVYWLQLSEPQWATLTVYVLAQPTVGAVLAKGAWRAIGTVVGGVVGLAIVALYSQVPEGLAAATVFLVAASFYVSARARNAASYGALLGAYTLLLVAFEGSATPASAWSIAIDRVAAILIGVGCTALASATLLPRYAGEALMEARGRTVRGLANYVATALRLATPPEVFARLRAQMVREVVSFDALRSSALFEAPELRADDRRLRHLVREFLIVLSVARGLFIRLGEFDGDAARRVHEEVFPRLEAIAASVERIGGGFSARSNLRGLRSDYLGAHRSLKEAARALEDMAGEAPYESLVASLLILSRCRDLLHHLAAIYLVETSIGGVRRGARERARRPADPLGRREALGIAIRAGVAIAVLTGWWMATGWSEGFGGVSGGAVMLFFCVNQDDALTGGRTYLIWATLGIIAGYLANALVLPQLQSFGELAVFLALVLLPAGLMAGTPKRAIAGVAFGAWTMVEVGGGNVFHPDELALINGAVAFVFGMIICLVIIAAFPVTSRARRAELWRKAIGEILPQVARGRLLPRKGANAIAVLLTAMLPRLALDRPRDEALFRGSLSAASSAIELGRMAAFERAPDMPDAAARALGEFRERFARALERIATSRPDRGASSTEAKAALEALRAELAHAEPTRSALRAAVSARFLADRFRLDPAYFEPGFAGAPGS